MSDSEPLGATYSGLRAGGPTLFAKETGRIRYWELLARERAALRDVRTGQVRPELLEHVVCAVCDGGIPCPSFEKDGFSYVRCTRCGTVFINPQLTEAAMLRFWTESPVAEAWTEVLRNPAQLEFDKAKYAKTLDQLAAQGLDRGRLLDFGCSIGVFLAQARSRGFEVAGVEPGEGARRVAAEMFDLALVSSAEELASPQKFDAITAWEVIEHTKEPVEHLRALRRLAGEHCIAVFLVGGNAASIANRVMRQASAAFDFARYWYFTPHSFERLLARAGWEPISVEQLLDEIDVVENYLRYGDPYQVPVGDEEVLPPDVAERLRALAHDAGMGYKFLVTARPA